MKLLHVVFLCILFATNITQAQWEQISTIGGNELRGVKFLNEHTGVVVGQSGIWRSTNSGVNWTQCLSGKSMNAVAFLDIDNGTAVGDSGTIFRTTDNGISWFQEASLTTNDLYTVSFPTSNSRFVLGENGVFLRFFINTWSIISTFGYDIYDAKMISANTGFVVGSQSNEIVRSTVNGGTNWFTALTATGKLNSIHCFNTGTNIAVGNNSRIRLTTNGGLTWTVQAVTSGHTFNCVTFPTNDTGFICGNDGTIFKTINFGTNWLAQFSNTSSSLKSLSFINSKTGWAIGSNGVVLHTTSGGITGISINQAQIPNEVKLYQNYPNPFNPATMINFDLTENSQVTLIIYDNLGRKVTNIIDNELMKGGSYSMEFDSQHYASGMYYYRLEAGSFVQSKKMVLVK